MLMHKAAAAECLRWQAALDGLWRSTGVLTASASSETLTISAQEAATWAADTGEMGCGLSLHFGAQLPAALGLLGQSLSGQACSICCLHTLVMSDPALQSRRSREPALPLCLPCALLSAQTA